MQVFIRKLFSVLWWIFPIFASLIEIDTSFFKRFYLHFHNLFYTKFPYARWMTGFKLRSEIEFVPRNSIKFAFLLAFEKKIRAT